MLTEHDAVKLQTTDTKTFKGEPLVEKGDIAQKRFF